MVFCVSKYTEKEIKKRVAEANTFVVPMGVSSLPNPDEKLVTEVGEKLKISRYSPVFLTVGAIKFRKGQLDTVKALSLLKDRYNNFLYLLVGSDADTNYVYQIREYVKKHGMSEHVEIVPHIQDSQTLAAVYKNTDVFVLTANNDEGHFEGFGLVLLEAAMFSLPSVGTRDCGVQEAILDGETGYLADQGDIEEIAESLEKAFRKRKRLGQKAKEWSDTFSWGKTVTAYVKQYKKSMVSNSH